MFEERIEYEIYGNVEYVINLLTKHNIKAISPKAQEESCRVKIHSKDKVKMESVLKNYGKKFIVFKTFGRALNAKKIVKIVPFWGGTILSILLVLVYTFSVSRVNIVGCKLVDETRVREIVLREKKGAFFLTRETANMLENKLLEIDGISYASIEKDGRTLEINIIEELSKVDKIDTQNFVSIKAKESGVVTKIVVYGGTALVKIGDKVEQNQELIVPYLKNAEEEVKPTLALGYVEAKVTRGLEIVYDSEEEYNARFAIDYEELIKNVKSGLLENEKYSGTHFFVKNVDKTIVCSIYYDIIARIT